MAILRAAALVAAALGVAGAESEVVKLSAGQEWDSFMAANEHTLVEFFAPWCGHCKALAPEYDDAAASLKEHGIKIGAVDAEKEKELAKKFSVSGFPTLKLFHKGELLKDYEGERKADAIYHTMRNWVDPSHKIPKPSAKDEWGEETGAVEFLDDESFDNYRANNPKMLTMFYAPWCGHCKALKPDFTTVSTEVAAVFAALEGDAAVQLSAVDCTSAERVCKAFDVSGYPTLVYFDSREDTGTKYEEGRSKKALKQFAVRKVVNDWAEVVPEYENSEEWKGEEHGNGAVVHLTDDHFDWYRNNKTKHLLMMFYAPWCGHCKALKPSWVEASLGVAKSFSMGALDCTAHASTCQTLGANSFPTIKYFEPLEADSKERAKSTAGEDYIGGRATDDLEWFARDKIERAMRMQAKSVTKDTDFSKLRIKALKKILKERGATCDGCTDKSDFVSKVKAVMEDMPAAAEKKERPKMTMMQEKRYKANKAAADKGWSQEEHGNGNVKHLIETDFDEWRAQHAPLLAMFYAPWCGHCKAMKPEFVDLSKSLAEESVAATVAALDCETSASVCQKYKATSYPTLLWFDKDSKQGEQFAGGRTAKAMLTWVQKKLDPDFKVELGEFKNTELWKDEEHGNGEVVHLDDDWFKPYMADHPKMLTMFYAPWCGHCKAMKPDFVKASEEAQSSGMVFSAIDCTSSSTICGEYGVNGYPTVKSFHQGKAADYEGGRNAADMVKFASSFGTEKSEEGATKTKKNAKVEIDKDDL